MENKKGDIFMSKVIKYVVTVDNEKLVEGETKNFRKNKSVLDVARKALTEKLAGKHKLCRVTVIRNDKKVGEWTCSPLKSKENAA